MYSVLIPIHLPPAHFRAERPHDPVQQPRGLLQVKILQVLFLVDFRQQIVVVEAIDARQRQLVLPLLARRHPHLLRALPSKLPPGVPQAPQGPGGTVLLRQLRDG